MSPLRAPGDNSLVFSKTSSCLKFAVVRCGGTGPGTILHHLFRQLGAALIAFAEAIAHLVQAAWA